MLPAALVALAYAIGSVPFSFLVVKLAAGKDVREHGSRNVGATNVARTAGKIPGIIALVLDVAKGYAAIVIARWLVMRPEWPFEHSRELWIALAGLIAVLGHMFPLWLRFHGGKGVATATGVFLALDPRVAAAAAIVFVIVVLVFRFVSLGSIVSAASVPLFFRFLAHDAPFWRIIVSIGISLAVILKHHENIKRLAQGAERKMGRKKDR
jgi:acyl phosphate:glycerol-3-phosphate acyltransferase